MLIVGKLSGDMLPPLRCRDAAQKSQITVELELLVLQVLFLVEAFGEGTSIEGLRRRQCRGQRL